MIPAVERTLNILLENISKNQETIEGPLPDLPGLPPEKD